MEGKSLEVDLDKNSLALVGSEQTLEISLAELEQVVREKNDIRLDFAPNEDVGDSFCSITFELPNQSSSVEELHNKLSGVMMKENTPLATFEGVKVLIPRGTCVVHFHRSFFKMEQGNNGTRIYYTNIAGVFCLLHQSRAFVVCALKDPLQKAGNHYNHIVMMFETDKLLETTLVKNEEGLTTRSSYKGPVHEVFCEILSALCDKRVTTEVKFKVESVLKEEPGLLYGLAESFFQPSHLPSKPASLLPHTEIKWVDFKRFNATGPNLHYYNLVVGLKTQEKPLVFSKIHRDSHGDLCQYMRNNYLQMMNDDGPKAVKIKIAVKFSVSLPLNNKISMLRMSVKKQVDECKDSEDFDIHFNGVALDDVDRELASYGIKEGDEVEVVLV